MEDVEQIVEALREGRAREALELVRALRDAGEAPAWRVNELFAECFYQLGDAEGAAAALWRAAQVDTVLRSQREHYSGYLFALHYLAGVSPKDLAQATRGYATLYQDTERRSLQDMEGCIPREIKSLPRWGAQALSALAVSACHTKERCRAQRGGEGPGGRAFSLQQNTPLHVGFLAPHFCDSSSARFYEAMVVGLAEMGIPVSLYSMSGRVDAFTHRLTAQVEQAQEQVDANASGGSQPVYRDLSALSLAAAAEAIRADAVDVLIDLGGHAEGGVTLMVLAYRPAPVQLTAIGWIDSTGLDFVDGVLSDAVLAPEDAGEEAYYTEKLVRMPRGSLCFTPTEAMREARIRMESLIRERRKGMAGGSVAALDPETSEGAGIFADEAACPCGLTFGCFQNFLKVNDAVLQAFAEILRQAPSARLVLQDVLPLAVRAEALRARCVQAGLPMERVTVRPGRRDYLADFAEVDVVLDTFPYPGGFMTALPCYLGLPVITLRGDHAGARFGAAVLTAMGQGSQVVGTVDAYIRQAVAYAQHPRTVWERRAVIQHAKPDGTQSKGLNRSVDADDHTTDGMQPMGRSRAEYARDLAETLRAFYADTVDAVDAADTVRPIRPSRQDLGVFLYPNPLPLHILTVDSDHYLPRLRELCPHAVIIEYGDGTPLEPGSFDLVVAETIFAEAKDPYDALMELSRLLTDTGTLLAAFPNVRYHGVLEALQRGEFPVRGRHLWAKAEVVRLLDDTLFKEIVFSPGVQDADEAAEQAWAALGFDDYSRDLATEVWLVRASRSTAEVANLKSLYDKKTRAELARILHRIEYDVNREENRRALRAFCEAHQIFPDYLRDFIHSTCAHAELVQQMLPVDG